MLFLRNYPAQLKEYFRLDSYKTIFIKTASQIDFL